MPQPLPTLDPALRNIKIIHLAMMAPIFVYAIIAERVVQPNATPPDMMLVWILAAMSVAMALGSLAVRSALVTRNADILRTDAANTSAIGRWIMGSIVAFALAESIALYGLVLRILGVQREYAFGFYAVSFVTLLLLTPRDPRQT